MWLHASWHVLAHLRPHKRDGQLLREDDQVHVLDAVAGAPPGLPRLAEGQLGAPVDQVEVESPLREKGRRYEGYNCLGAPLNGNKPHK